MANVLVLGCCGFIGRHLTMALLDAGHFVRGVDKRPPGNAYLPPAIEAKMDPETNANFEFMQADVSSPASVDRVFGPSEAHPEVTSFATVFSAAAQTKLGLSDMMYDKDVVTIAANVAKKCSETGARLIYFSDARILRASPDDKGAAPAAEEATQKPSTLLAAAHQRAEAAIKESGLTNYVILRPAIVYGLGDKDGLTNRVLCGSVYKKTGKPMKMLWTAKLRINTVNVQDVVKAALLAAEKAPNGAVYNLADSNDTDQGFMNELIGDIFGIKTGFMNALINAAAGANASLAERTVNETHIEPWGEICKSQGMSNVAIAPIIPAELLLQKNVWVDGSKITKDLGFAYAVPAPTKEIIKEQIQELIDQKLIPNIFAI